jgi:hypothetical protein
MAGWLGTWVSMERSRFHNTGVTKTGVTKTGVTKTGVTKTEVTKTGVTKTDVTKTGVTKTSVTETAQEKKMHRSSLTWASMAHRDNTGTSVNMGVYGPLV